MSSAEVADRFAALAAALPLDDVLWRRNGDTFERKGKWLCPHVAYVDAPTVQRRLDAVFPGLWSLAHDVILPEHGEGDDAISMRARLTIRVETEDGNYYNLTREGIGSGKNYKDAATDSFKRAAVKWGVALELYEMDGLLLVEMESNGKYAKPVRPPADVYASRQAWLASKGKGRDGSSVPPQQRGSVGESSPSPKPAAAARATVTSGGPERPLFDDTDDLPF